MWAGSGRGVKSYARPRSVRIVCTMSVARNSRRSWLHWSAQMDGTLTKVAYFAPGVWLTSRAMQLLMSFTGYPLLIRRSPVAVSWRRGGRSCDETLIAAVNRVTNSTPWWLLVTVCPPSRTQQCLLARPLYAFRSHSGTFPRHALEFRSREI
jgi:hypothetical protein